MLGGQAGRTNARRNQCRRAGGRVLERVKFSRIMVGREAPDWKVLKTKVHTKQKNIHKQIEGWWQAAGPFSFVTNWRFEFLLILDRQPKSSNLDVKLLPKPCSLAPSAHLGIRSAWNSYWVVGRACRECSECHRQNNLFRKYSPAADPSPPAWPLGAVSVLFSLILFSFLCSWGTRVTNKAYCSTIMCYFGVLPDFLLLFSNELSVLGTYGIDCMCLFYGVLHFR